MTYPKGVTSAHLELTLERQRHGRAGKNYLPSILLSGTLDRVAHLLSPAERAAALFLLHNPDLIDLREQPMLFDGFSSID